MSHMKSMNICEDVYEDEKESDFDVSYDVYEEESDCGVLYEIYEDECEDVYEDEKASNCGVPFEIYEDGCEDVYEEEKESDCGVAYEINEDGCEDVYEDGKESDCEVSYEIYEDRCEDVYEDEKESDCGEDGLYDEFEGDEDARACFPCPFCYVEIEIHALCNHFQEEHCFDLTNAVCPICAANLGKDVIGHFVVQHASSLKRRRKSQKSGIWSCSPATLGRELSSFIGSSTFARGNAHESAPDPFLSPFLYNAPVSDTKDVQRDKCSDEAIVASNLKRTEPPLPDKDHEQNTEERRQRAAFVQRLVLSTIF